METRLLNIAMTCILVPAFLWGVPGTLIAKEAAVLKAEYGKLPLSFEANQGQTDAKVRFLSRGPGYKLFLTPTEAALALSKSSQSKAKVAARDSATIEQPPALENAVLRIQFVGANAKPKVVGRNELPGKVNYFRGNDPNKWRTNVPTYGKVLYESVYPGIDLVYYGNQQQLEYDFVVAPGVDPKDIRLAFDGAEQLSLDERGNLVIETAGVKILQKAPRVYQNVDGKRHEVDGRYLIRENQTVQFQVAAYDARLPLVIDPVLVYSTYLGGSGRDYGLDIAVNASGNAYLTGWTTSLDFPTANAIAEENGGGSDSDAFVTKLSPDGASLVFSSYFGGSGDDGGSGIALDEGGNPHIAGLTNSTDFPTLQAIQSSNAGGFDAFVAKLSAAGDAILFSTYLGGSEDEINESVPFGFVGPRNIAMNETGIYVAGTTESSDFPTTAGAFQMAKSAAADAFVTKLHPLGTQIIYSTYLGGDGAEDGFTVDVDSSGNAYVAGVNFGSSNYPTTPSAFQQCVFAAGDNDLVAVTKLNAAGSALVYSTCLGGNGDDDAGAITVDEDGYAYVRGYTASPDFPTTPGAFQTALAGGTDIYVTKFSVTGSELVYSTFIGGTAGETASGSIQVDASGVAYVTGATASIDFPTVDAIQPLSGGASDAVIMMLDPSGSILSFSTYLGGSGLDFADSLAIDGDGNIYITGITFFADDFPTVNPVQPNLGGDADAFVAKIAEAQLLPVGIDIKPGNKRNAINPREKGSIWVAILSDTETPFDPPSQVDIATVEFGSDGAEAARYKVKDVNRDGLGDLLLRFRIPETGIACGDTEATLTGETLDGQSITGTDSIRTVGCNKK